MDYPHFKPHLTNDEVIEHFTLTQEERFLLSRWRKDKNILGSAVLLKTFQFLGYPPHRQEEVPTYVLSLISCQLKLDINLFGAYKWKDSVWKDHLSLIRDFTGFRPCKEDDIQGLFQWLVDEAANHPTRPKMFTAAIQRCRHLHIELPVEKELQRLVSSTWQQYLNITCQKISERLTPETREKMDKCLDLAPNDKERYEWMKGNPGKFGMKSLICEIKRLRFVNEFDIKTDFHLKNVPDNVLKLLSERAAPEGLMTR